MAAKYPRLIQSGPLSGRTFASEGRYRAALSEARGHPSHRQLLNAQARERGFPNREAQRRAPQRIRTREQLEGLSKTADTGRKDALAIVRIMRQAKNRGDAISLTEAVRRGRNQGIRTTADTVRRYAGPALETERGRTVVKDRDTIFRQGMIISEGRIVEVDTRSSRASSAVGRYGRAIRTYLETGDSGPLLKFRGRTVAGVPYETDLDVIVELAGELSDELDQGWHS